MLGAFRRPRIEGRFVGDEMRAWGVTWGEVDGDFVVENKYANVSRAVIRAGASRMDVSGQFSLGYPRADGGEEIDARIRIDTAARSRTSWRRSISRTTTSTAWCPAISTSTAITQPHGFGRLVITQGAAYGEPFSDATASLRFEGEGVRLDGIDDHKGRRPP